MIRAARFVAAAEGAGFRLATGVPCSDLGGIVGALEAGSGCRWIGAANEGDAVAVASGAALGGAPALVLMQNSGLGNAVNPLTSLCLVFRIPVLLVVAWRGEPAGPADEPQHALMGRITTGLLDLMGIAWERLAPEESALAPALGRAVEHMRQARTPYALVVGRGTLETAGPSGPSRPDEAAARASSEPPDAAAWPSERPSRRALIAAVQRALGPRDVLLATTGYAGREMSALADRPNQLAMVGSMGCVGSLGLGLAWARRERRIVVLDGDGAALMRLGALATLAAERPANLVHVLLDNEMHESTGGQATGSARADLGAVAHAAGYPRVVRVRSAAELAELVAADVGILTFVHVKVAPSREPAPPRPRRSPAEAAVRLMEWLAGGPA